MNDRRFLLLAVVSAMASRAAAQAPVLKLRRVGVLAPSTHAREEITLKPFFEQMRQLGWIEGHNIAYDRAYANDRHELLNGLALELVSRKPEVIYAPPTPAAVAAKRATGTIPIVFGVVTDAVGIGLLRSLAHPGGNVTGMGANIDGALGSKRVEILREILPGLKRLGLLGDPSDPTGKVELDSLKPLVNSLGLTLVFSEAGNPADFDAAVARLLAQKAQAILPVGTTVLASNMRERLVDLGNEKRVPIVASRSFMADAGALFAYGASLPDQLRRSAFLVDKVLKGAKPGELPVEQPTLFELVVNLKAARFLGITIPRSILSRADRVIE